MQLGQAIPVCILNDHYRGVGHVDPHLNDSGGHQHLGAAGGKIRQSGRLFTRGLAAIGQSHAEVPERPAGQFLRVRLHGLEAVLPVPLVILFHQRADDIGLPPGGELVTQKAIHGLALTLAHDARIHRQAAGRHLVNDGQVQIAVEHQRQGTRNGRGAHHQQMRSVRAIPALVEQSGALGHAESVLLVGHAQAQAVIDHIATDERMRAHHHAPCA